MWFKFFFVFNFLTLFVQVVMATNRIETLDPALIRPGRIDRKIEFPLPDEKTKRRIFTIHTSRMTLADDVNIEDYVMSKDDLSGADIKVFDMLRCCFSKTFENVSTCESSQMLIWKNLLFFFFKTCDIVSEVNN